jgi:hypothetical protein
MTETKKIYTFTQLLNRARRMFEKDPAEYAKALSDGTAKLVPGLIVRISQWGQDRSPSCFRFYAGSDIQSIKYADAYCQVQSVWMNGKRYTHWDIEASATKYRKRVHKFLPVTLPEGMKCNSHAYYTKAIYHNADGSVAMEGKWESGRRGYPGNPHQLQMLFARDSDGKLIRFHDEEFAGLESLRIRGGMDLTPSLRGNEVFGQAHSKIEWYNSMKCPEDLPGIWDEDRVRLMAAKVHSEFLSFSKQYPHCKIVMFPMVRRVPGENTPAAHGLLTGGPFMHMNPRRFHVLHRDSTNNPIAFYLPEIVMWWDDASQKSDVYHGGDNATFIKAVIPPYGCELLKPGETSSFSETFMWGQGVHGYERAMKNKVPLETVFHSFRAKAAGTPAEARIEGTHYSLLMRGKHGMDKSLANFYTGRNLVCVYDASTHELRSLSNLGGYAMQPSDILARVKEKELIDSLPLC